MLKLISSKPIDILSDILIKFDTHSLKGFTGYVKIRLLSLYEVTCTKAICNTCQRNQPNIASRQPKVEDMVITAINALNEVNGPSTKSIINYIAANNNTDNIDKLSSQVKNCLVRGVKTKKFQRTSGRGASGNFKLIKKNP